MGFGSYNQVKLGEVINFVELNLETFLWWDLKV